MTRRHARTVVVMGVAGSGKTVVGSELARRLAVDFLDADTLHTPAAVAQMRAGEPLTESDRRDWLTRVITAIERAQPGVVACSALRRDHRDRLRSGPGVQVAHLDVPEHLLRRRLKARTDHFFPVSLLEDQLRTFEAPLPDEPVLVVDGTRDVDAIVEEVVSRLTGPVPA